MFNVGWLCVGSALLLSILGVLAIGTTEPSLAMKHIVHLALGIVAATIVALPHFRHAQYVAYPMMVIVLAMLVFVLLPGVPDAIVHPRKGARRWINLQVMDFQPSELAKIGYVLVLATYLQLRRSYRTLRGLLLPLLLTFVPMALILIEPDLGTSLLFLPTLFAMLIAAGAKLRHITLVIVLGLSIAPMMYPLLKPHQKDRIRAMFQPERFENDIGFQRTRAMTLVGAGGLTGAGAAKSRDLIKYNGLPEEHNDMIFAVVTCRWGMLGGILTWGLFGMLCLGGLLVAGQNKDPLGRLIAVGIVAVLFSQMVINTGMTIGLMPITGMTLPFVSSGGSSLIAAWIMVGLLLNIAMRRPRSLFRQAFEFDGESNER